MKILVIYNPTSGSGNSIDVVQQVISCLEEKKVSYDSYQSKSKTDLIKYVEENARKYKAVFGIGGDGTIRDIIYALSHINFVIPLGIFPGGSGNDLVKSLGIKQDIKEITERYLQGNIDTIYSCSLNEGMFVNIAGVGIDVNILRKRLDLKKYLPGKLCYVVSTLLALFTYKPAKYKIKIDNKEIIGEFYIVVVANGKYFGAGMKVAPNADLRKKQLTILTLDKVSKLKLIKAFLNIYKGTHVDMAEIKQYQADVVDIDFLGDKLDINFDGDLVTDKHLLAYKSDFRDIKILI